MRSHSHRSGRRASAWTVEPNVYAVARHIDGFNVRIVAKKRPSFIRYPYATGVLKIGTKFIEQGLALGW